MNGFDRAYNTKMINGLSKINASTVKTNSLEVEQIDLIGDALLESVAASSILKTDANKNIAAVLDASGVLHSDGAGDYEFRAIDPQDLGLTGVGYVYDNGTALITRQDGSFTTLTVSGSTTLGALSAAGITASSLNSSGVINAPNVVLSNGSNQLALSNITVTAPTALSSRTYTVPDVLANASFVMTEGNQSINGDKTFNDDVVVNGTVTLGNVAINNINANNLVVADNTTLGSNNLDTLIINATGSFLAPISTANITSSGTVSGLSLSAGSGGIVDAGNLTVSGSSSLQAITAVGLTNTGNISSSTIGVSGLSSLQGVTCTALTNTGSSNLQAVSATSVASTGNISGTNISGTTLNISGASTQGSINCTGLTTSGSVSAGSGSFATLASGPATVSGALSASSLNISGNSVLQAVDAASLNVAGNTVLGDAITDTLNVNAVSTFNQAVNMNGSLTVVGDMSVDSGTFQINSATNTVSMGAGSTFVVDTSDMVIDTTITRIAIGTNAPSQRFTVVSNNSAGQKVVIGNVTTEARGLMTLNQNLNQNVAINIDPTDSGRTLVLTNTYNTTQTQTQNSGAIGMQILGAGGGNVGRVYNDIICTREALNTSTGQFMFNSFNSTFTGYNTIAKLGYVNHSFIGGMGGSVSLNCQTVPSSLGYHILLGDGVGNGNTYAGGTFTSNGRIQTLASSNQLVLGNGINTTITTTPVANRVLTIPDIGVAAGSFVMNQGSSFINGDLTCNNLTVVNASITGTTMGVGTALTVGTTLNVGTNATISGTLITPTANVTSTLTAADTTVTGVFQTTGTLNVLQQDVVLGQTVADNCTINGDTYIIQPCKFSAATNQIVLNNANVSGQSCTINGGGQSLACINTIPNMNNASNSFLCVNNWDTIIAPDAQTYIKTHYFQRGGGPVSTNGSNEILYFRITFPLTGAGNQFIPYNLEISISSVRTSNNAVRACKLQCTIYTNGAGTVTGTVIQQQNTTGTFGGGAPNVTFSWDGLNTAAMVAVDLNLANFSYYHTVFSSCTGRPFSRFYAEYF